MIPVRCIGSSNDCFTELLHSHRSRIAFNNDCIFENAIGVIIKEYTYMYILHLTSN